MSIMGEYIHAIPDALKTGWYSFKRDSTLRGIIDTGRALDENIGRADRNLVYTLTGKLTRRF